MREKVKGSESNMAKDTVSLFFRKPLTCLNKCVRMNLFKQDGIAHDGKRRRRWQSMNRTYRLCFV